MDSVVCILNSQWNFVKRLKDKLVNVQTVRCGLWVLLHNGVHHFTYCLSCCAWVLLCFRSFVEEFVFICIGYDHSARRHFSTIRVVIFARVTLYQVKKSGSKLIHVTQGTKTHFARKAKLSSHTHCHLKCCSEQIWRVPWVLKVSTSGLSYNSYLNCC